MSEQNSKEVVTSVGLSTVVTSKIGTLAARPWPGAVARPAPRSLAVDTIAKAPIGQHMLTEQPQSTSAVSALATSELRQRTAGLAAELADVRALCRANRQAHSCPQECVVRQFRRGVPLHELDGRTAFRRALGYGQ